jgi:beta-xylosidase
MSTAAQPEGPWAPLTEVKRAFHWEDPCPFWDDDGNAYLGHSYYGAGPIVIHRMSKDGKQLLDDGVTVYTGPVAEGTKFLKYNGYYYLIIPEGGVATGWQTVLRSKNIYGPYEKRVVLEMGSTGINGPHQGGLVDTKNGEWWFIHFQDRGTIGRVVHLQPVSWINGWPEMGVDIDRNGIGEPVYVFKKPDVGNTYPLSAPQSSDEFNMPDLGLQWAWNHNPVEKGWSLSENPGFLTLHALQAPDIWKAPNTLTQKIMGDRGTIRAQFDLSAMMEGQQAGLCLISSMECQCGFIKQDGKVKFYATDNGKTTWGDPCPSKTAWIRISIDLATDEAKLQCSQQDNNYKTILACRNLKGGHWKGLRAGIFNFNTLSSSGAVKVNRFIYNYDGPLGSMIIK